MLEFVIGLLLGLLLFLLPILIGPKIPAGYRYRLSSIYFDMACRVFNRIVILSKKHGQLEFFSSEYDPIKQAEKINLGDDAYFEDPYNGAVSYLNNRECMFTDERVSFIYNPMIATCAEHLQTLFRSGNYKKTFSDPTSETEFTAYCGHLYIPSKRSFTNLKSVTSLMPASAPPNLPSSVERYVEISQREFKRNIPFVEIGAAITFFIVGYGVGAISMFMLENNPVPPGIVDVLPVFIGGFL
jgi:hypothetical protein